MCIALAPSHVAQLGNYTSWLEKNGLPYKILKPGDSLENFLMLILCGGPDLEKPGTEARYAAEKQWFTEAYGKIPVIGICRGLQLANVVAGGTLFEDISETPIKHTSNKILLEGKTEPVLESSWHNIVFEDGEKIKVNSRHHQAIKNLAPGFISIAKSETDGIYEMVQGQNSLFVQWHPEREDVWGTKAEKIVSDWIRTKIDVSETLKIDPKSQIFNKIVNYLYVKGFTVISRERILKSIDERCTNVFLDELIESYPFVLKNVKDKNGKPAIKLNSNRRSNI